jgi:hypothetical protein
MSNVSSCSERKSQRTRRSHTKVLPCNSTVCNKAANCVRHKPKSKGLDYQATFPVIDAICIGFKCKQEDID